MSRTRVHRTPPRRGPIEGPIVIGYDADPGRRPGVPREAERPTGPVPTRPLTEQQGASKPLIRVGLDEPTPVYGTGQPPRGVSGAIRQAAYRVPEHYARRWMLLLLSDRVDVLEDRLGELVAKPAERAGMDGVAETARRNPIPLLVGIAVGSWGLSKLLR